MDAAHGLRQLGRSPLDLIQNGFMRVGHLSSGMVEVRSFRSASETDDELKRRGNKDG
jgi:hypothetical protein